MSDPLARVDFEQFFRELHGYAPFPWQSRLAMKVCEGQWPGSLDLPTASGKTACIDVAVFAMALRMLGPRRIFFVVDRRVVVDAAFERMQKIARMLREADGGVLKTVADRLREMGQDESPIDAYEMRGGIYRDDTWVRSPLQPTLIASTVDQVGSRLLFRGYGHWDKQWPIHAALAANDALILLDEAHCARPFSETLAAVARYRGREWPEAAIDSPFAFVQMTATPAGPGDEPFTLDDDDYRDPQLRKRLFAKKAARLVLSKARLKDFAQMAENLAGEAMELEKKPGLRRIAVLVNRVRTAKLALEELRKHGRRTHLLIGRMRPVDRASLPADLTAMLSDKTRAPDGEPVFVVATQCLEVGADLDFDGIVTECASIDALLQRFGRLDRVGELGIGEGRVVISTAMADQKYRDPVYAEALSKTWNWLKSLGDEVDFGICSEAGEGTVRERLALAGAAAGELRRDSPRAPVLLPAHLDQLVQTSPQPAVSPDVHLYLHGTEMRSPEVQVVWRGDLDVEHPDSWAEIVSLCPPVAAEAMTVPLRDFLGWLTGRGDESTASADVEGIGAEDEDIEGKPRCPVLQWRGDQSRLIRTDGDLDLVRPGDTLVLAEASGGWEDLGHIPERPGIDAAEEARWELRRGWVLRLHPALIGRWPEHEARDRLRELSGQPEIALEDARQALFDYREAAPVWLAKMIERFPRKAERNAYPSGDGTPVGWVLSARSVEADSGQDESSVSDPVFLDTHLADVTRTVRGFATAVIRDEATRRSLERAARVHDAGKADTRFQALLRGGDPMAAQFAPRPLAKGAQARQSPAVRQAQWARSGLPEGFRHELISLLLARETEACDDDLALHLIASHHGRCRPFAPVVRDDGGDLAYNGWSIAREQRLAQAAHRLDSGVADRFWRLTRRYGWWGLAYLEALLRLGDWKASKEETA